MFEIFEDVSSARLSRGLYSTKRIGNDPVLNEAVKLPVMTTRRVVNVLHRGRLFLMRENYTDTLIHQIHQFSDPINFVGAVRCGAVHSNRKAHKAQVATAGELDPHKLPPDNSAAPTRAPISRPTTIAISSRVPLIFHL